MTNRLIFTIFIFISCCFQGVTQQISFKVDSIKIYHLPLSMKTFLSLSDYDIRNWEGKIMNENILQIHHITETSEISTFTEAEIMNPSNITNFNYSIDARIVIDIFMEKGVVLSIVMDENGYYILGNEKKQRSRNEKLNSWLRKYIPDLK